MFVCVHDEQELVLGKEVATQQNILVACHFPEIFARFVLCVLFVRGGLLRHVRTQGTTGYSQGSAANDDGDIFADIRILVDQDGGLTRIIHELGNPSPAHDGRVGARVDERISLDLAAAKPLAKPNSHPHDKALFMRERVALQALLVPSRNAEGVIVNEDHRKRSRAPASPRPRTVGLEPFLSGVKKRTGSPGCARISSA